MDISQIQYLSSIEANNLLSLVRNQRHRLLILLMVDCGLRVSECISLRLANFDFKEKLLQVKSLKKRNKQVLRSIPISMRLYQELSDYLNKQHGILATDFLFPNINNPAYHISRFAVNKMLARLQYRHPVSSVNLHPHTLRHTFATQHLSAGTPLHNIKEMLGHTSLNTTLIYAHIPTEQLRQNVENVTNPQSKFNKFWKRIYSQITFKSSGQSINIHFRNTGIPTVGRNTILKTVLSNVQKGINTCLLGNVGVGKTHLLNIIKETPDLKILALDNTADLKPSLAQMLLYILQTDQKGVYDFLYPGWDYNKALTHISRDAVHNIANRLLEITPKKYYTLLIDNVDGITPKAVKVLEIFKDHFTIVTSARSIAVNRSSFLWNFDVVRLKDLPRDDAMKLIQAHAAGLEVQDYNLLRNHIYEQTNGNPRAIEEIIARYRKETNISNTIIRQIRHTGALSEIDCSFAIIIFLAAVACLRYLNHEVSNASFRVIGGIGLMLLFISRYIFRFTRKTHV